MVTIKRRQERIKLAAERFLDEHMPKVDRQYPSKDERTIILSVEGAFLLYDYDWKGTGFNILNWKYPSSEMESGQGYSSMFQGFNPWSVLFRHALSMYRNHTTKS